MIHGVSERLPLSGSPLEIRDDVMSHASIREPSSTNAVHHLKRRWRRGVLVEYALVALFIAFTVSQFLFVFGTKAS